MPVCRYFRSETGCLKGDTCHFQHAEPEKYERLKSHRSDPSTELQDLMPSLIIADDIQTQIPTGAYSLIKTRCHFFDNGTCKHGDKCRFRHDTINKAVSPDESTTHRADSISLGQNFVPRLQGHQTNFIEQPASNIRDLGGAVVLFGSGGEVLGIELAVGTNTRVQTCTVYCTWYRPSKTAVLEFPSAQIMEAASQRLSTCKVIGRTLDCSSKINKALKPWHYTIKIGNLDVSTQAYMLKGVCREYKPKRTTFGPPSYSSTNEEIGTAIQRILSASGKIEAWKVLPMEPNANRCKATAVFSTEEQARNSVVKFDNYQLPQLGGLQILLRYYIKTTVSILTPMHTAIASELEQLQQVMSTNEDLRIVSYPAPDNVHRFTIVQITSKNAKDVGRTKAAIEKILVGHTARSGKDIIWNDLFTKPEGLSYLSKIGKEHDVFIYRNAKKRLLSLYGDEENNAVVESILANAVNDLESDTFVIDLNEKIGLSVYQAAYRRIVGKLGKTAAYFSLTSTPKTVTIRGSSQDADWARLLLQEQPDQANVATADVEDKVTCEICWCDAEDPYTTPCSHVYDRDCFLNQCLSSDDKDFPIKCLGAAGSCRTAFSFHDLEAALTRDQLDKLLERSFRSYIRTHPTKHQYCPTADCDQIYEVRENGEIFTCARCFTSICTTCGAVSHEGLTCGQYKEAVLGEDAFAEWKKANDARDCPKCGSVIQKAEGCNHMQCKACDAHICWACMQVFDTSGLTYEHLQRTHSGFYDRGHGDE